LNLDQNATDDATSNDVVERHIWPLFFRFVVVVVEWCRHKTRVFGVEYSTRCFDQRRWGKNAFGRVLVGRRKIEKMHRLRFEEYFQRGDDDDDDDDSVRIRKTEAMLFSLQIIDERCDCYESLLLFLWENQQRKSEDSRTV